MLCTRACPVVYMQRAAYLLWTAACRSRRRRLSAAAAAAEARPSPASACPAGPAGGSTLPTPLCSRAGPSAGSALPHTTTTQSPPGLHSTTTHAYSHIITISWKRIYFNIFGIIFTKAVLVNDMQFFMFQMFFNSYKVKINNRKIVELPTAGKEPDSGH